SAQLHTEISSINPEVTVRDMPGLRKQSAATVANLRSGETLVIAGMVSYEISASVDRIPALGALPVLGKLFRSRRFQNRESEMIILVTPRLQTAPNEREDERADTMARRYDALREKCRMLD